jgi:hypothetical protein
MVGDGDSRGRIILPRVLEFIPGCNGFRREMRAQNSILTI